MSSSLFIVFFQTVSLFSVTSVYPASEPIVIVGASLVTTSNPVLVTLNNFLPLSKLAVPSAYELLSSPLTLLL